MILDTLDNAHRYHGLNPLFEQAFSFLRRTDLPTLPEGKHTINGDQLFAIIAHDQGRKVDEAELEGHREYIDIQYIIRGEESMGWRANDGLINTVPYDTEKDLEFFAEAPQSLVPVPPRSFVIFFPEDAHLPLVGDGSIHKIIVKVKLADCSA